MNVLQLTFQHIQDEYASGGWTKHHTQMLEYEETDSENTKPSITFEVAEPADDMERNWKVTTISVVRVSNTFSLLVLLSCLISSFQYSFMDSCLCMLYTCSLRNQSWIS